MRNTITRNSVFQRLDDVFLGDDFIPELGTPFAVEGLGHGGGKLKVTG